jgi:hypothetical protein
MMIKVINKGVLPGMVAISLRTVRLASSS